ncbi:MAG: hypothetical protein KDK51_05690 [Deltaproteobacteria bacterium]|nr:hypothetical protein [Deltaproteobacteria bacterium]
MAKYTLQFIAILLIVPAMILTGCNPEEKSPKVTNPGKLSTGAGDDEAPKKVAIKDLTAEDVEIQATPTVTAEKITLAFTVKYKVEVEGAFYTIELLDTDGEPVVLDTPIPASKEATLSHDIPPVDEETTYATRITFHDEAGEVKSNPIVGPKIVVTPASDEKNDPIAFGALKKENILFTSAATAADNGKITLTFTIAYKVTLEDPHYSIQLIDASSNPVDEIKAGKTSPFTKTIDAPQEKTTYKVLVTVHNQKADDASDVFEFDALDIPAAGSTQDVFSSKEAFNKGVNVKVSEEGSERGITITAPESHDFLYFYAENETGAYASDGGPCQGIGLANYQSEKFTPIEMEEDSEQHTRTGALTIKSDKDEVYIRIAAEDKTDKNKCVVFYFQQPFKKAAQ